MSKKKYKGEFNVSGETNTLYVHAIDEADAKRLFGRRLSGKYGRQIFIDRLDYTIKEA